MKNIFAASGGGFWVLCLLLLLGVRIRTLGQAPDTDDNPRLNKRMHLTVSNKSLKTILALISDSTGLQFVASGNQLDVTEHYSITVHDVPVSAILVELLGRQGFSWIARDTQVVFSRSGPLKPLPPGSLAKKIPDKMNVITGIVMDTGGMKLPGATVRINGTNIGGTTNSAGRFTFSTEREDFTITTTYTGYNTVVREINVDDSIRIRLVRSNTILDETVIMAYGNTTKRTNTGSISKVASRDIANQPVVSLLGALEFRVPGLEVTPSSGVNGTSFTVQLRGKNSFANGSAPLYIIDGVPYTSSKKIDILVSIATQNNDAGGISPFNNLNKEDIESIEILKDADATAIYGSRGANGVVLITTKRGKAGKPTLFLKAGTGIGTVPGLGNMLNKAQYMEMRNEAFTNDNISPDHEEGKPGYAPDLTIWDQNRDHNWQKMLIGGTAKLYNLHMAFSGGDSVIQYRASGSLLKGTAVFPGDMPYARGTGDVSGTYLSRNKKLSIDLNSNYGKDKNVLFNGTLIGLIAPPDAPGPVDENGNLVWEENGGKYDNPIADLRKKYTISTANLLGSLKTRYYIADSLSFVLSAGWNRYRDSEISEFPSTARNPNSDSVTRGSSSFSTQEVRSYILEPQLDYVNTFSWGKINLLVGTTWQYSSIKNWVMEGSNYPDNSRLFDYNAAPTKHTVATNDYKYKYAAVFGRVIYNYKDRYIFNLSARRDGSSRFGPGKRWSNFGSVGGAWLFSNEGFIKDKLDWLNYGKVRGSYGITGNDQIGDYRYLDTWSNDQLKPYQGVNTIVPDALLNTSFLWERSKKIETAIELGFLENKLITTIAYFNNRNDRQLIPYVLSAQTGFLSIIKNEDVVISNTGWEFDMTFDVINHRKFNWRIAANITLPKNKLVAFPNLDIYDFASDYKIGQSLSVLKKYHNTGVDLQTGLFTYEDVDKNGLLNSSDFKVIGNLDPKFYGGINNSLQWKKFRVDLFLAFRKQTVPNYFYAMFFRRLVPGTLANQADWVLERWQHEGDKAKVQRYTTVADPDGLVSSSDFGYENNFFVKLKNVSLYYSINKKTRFYLQGQNLLTFTKYKGLDPETPFYFSLPPLRIMTVGLEIVL